MKTVLLLGLALVIVALALFPGRLRTRHAHSMPPDSPAHVRALSLDDMERLRQARRALVDAERQRTPVTQTAE